jgi:hypothetical protein
VILRIDFNEGQTGIQLCNAKIDENANNLYTGVNNFKNSAWKKISKHIEITILPHTTLDSLLIILHISGEQEQQLGQKCYLLKIHFSNQRRNYCFSLGPLQVYLLTPRFIFSKHQLDPYY